MERIKNLDRYQKGILLLLIVMVVIFTVVYFLTIYRVGFAYKDAILVPSDEEGNTVYSGIIKGENCAFVVTADNSVTFYCGEKVYGPYVLIEDPSAVPEGHTCAQGMTGVEIRLGDDTFFRGGYFLAGEYYMLFQEDGSSIINVTIAFGDGTVVDSEGNAVDDMAPNAETIIKILDDPELTHKGDWQAWFLAVFVSIATTVSILFADELFRWNLSFQVRDVDHVEPSELELAGRYIGWTVLPIMSLIIYVMGLQ